MTPLHNQDPAVSGPEKERQFHNKIFEAGTRAKLTSFYSIMHEGRLYFEKLLLNRADNNREVTVLEYGCGAGSYAFQLAEQGAQVTAIDISDVAIQLASEKAKRKGIDIKFLRMNGEQLDFPDKSFDLIFGIAILHHLELNRAFHEISRVLKPGGQAIFMEPLGHNPIINLYRKLTPGMRTPDEHPLKIHDILLAENYFKTVERKYFILQSLFAVPFKGTKLFRPILYHLEASDRVLFKLAPFVKRYAWQVILTLKSQSPNRETNRHQDVC